MQYNTVSYLLCPQSEKKLKYKFITKTFYCRIIETLNHQSQPEVLHGTVSDRHAKDRCGNGMFV